MCEKSVLVELIERAIDDCQTFGSGRCEDEEWGTELRVTANWIETGDPLYPSIIEINIYQDDVLKLSYEDPTTKTA